MYVTSMFYSGKSVIMMQATVLTVLFVGAALGNRFKVVGGSDAAPGQFPFMVSLQNSSSSHRCGASLIAPDWIVTTAYCFDKEEPSSFKVVAGTNTLNSSGTEFEVSKIIIHPQYNSWDIINDIALAKLSSPIQETSLIQIIPLETTNEDSARNVTLIGWGATSYPGNISNTLQHLPLKTITYDECKANSSGTIVSSEICTLTKAGEGPCQGDEGSPLVGKRNDTTILVGIASHGIPCALGYPDVYTRVSSFTDWIKNETGITFS